MAYELGRSEDRRSAFLIIYADSPKLPFPVHLRSADWQKFVAALRPGVIPFAVHPYEWIIDIASARAQSDAQLWSNLKAWVDRKIDAISPKGHAHHPKF